MTSSKTGGRNIRSKKSRAGRAEKRRIAAERIIALLADSGADRSSLARIRALETEDRNFAEDFIAAVRHALAAPARRPRFRRHTGPDF